MNKQEQIDQMWTDHVHEGWQTLANMYHRWYRGVSWPAEATREVVEARAKAEANPQG